MYKGRVKRGRKPWEPKRTDLIWRDRKEEVMEEVAKVLGLETATSRSPGFFAARQKALLKMLARLTEIELKALDAEVERISREGNPEEVKRQ